MELQKVTNNTQIKYMYTINIYQKVYAIKILNFLFRLSQEIF